MEPTAPIDDRLCSLDVGLFRYVPSESSDSDKESLLACQRATREICNPYVYLEIGSHLGGSLQPYLVDPRCRRAYSIDKRPDSIPDERGLTFRYPDNSTERMRRLLRDVPGADIDKLTCLEGDTATLSRELEAPNLCFIDGEHTDEAALRDFSFCREVLGQSGAIIFHDAQIVYNGIAQAIEGLRAQRIPFHAYNLPDCLLVIEVGDFPLHNDPAIAAALLDNHVGYLASLKLNDHFRRLANQPLLKAARTLRARLKRTDISSNG